MTSRNVRRPAVVSEALENRLLFAVNLYASPSGSALATNNGQDINSPVSLERARDIVRGLNDNMSQEVVVNLRGGTYARTSTFALDAQDSGTNGHDVVWKAYGSETPVISGGQNVTGWTTTTVNGKTAWVATLAGSQFPDGLRDLYVNGERRDRAKSEAFQPTGMLRNTNGDATGLRVEVPGVSSFAVPADLEVQQQVKWKQYILPVTAAASAGNGRVDLTVPEARQEWLSPDFVGFKSGGAIVLENAIELLDQPGEWYFDKANSKIYYAPKAGEAINSVTVTVPVLERLFQVTGTSTTMVRDLRVEGVTFEYGGWASPNRTGWFGYDPGHIIAGDGRQGGFSFANVYADYVDDTAFTGNTFRRMGGVGLHVRRATDLNVVGNLFTDIAADGLGVGEVVDPAFSLTNINISNNLVYKAGHQFRMTSGILTGRMLGATIHHNHVRDVSYIGINAYKVFGNKLAAWGNLSVRYNLIENTMGETFDGGAFYTWQSSTSDGSYSVFSDNLMRGIFSKKDSQAIYLDETPRYWLVERNVIEDAKDRWYLIKGGDLTFRNNYTTISKSLRTNLLATPNIVEEGTTVDPSGTWSNYPEAAATVANAGLEPAHAGLLNRVPPLPVTNAVPVVDAGPDRTVGLNQKLRIEATVSDDRAPFDVLRMEWTKVSGPGTVSFFGQQTTVTDAIVAFGAPGTYVLRLTADDQKVTTFDDVTVTVTAADLGPNIALGLPATSYTASNANSPGEVAANAFDNNAGSYWYPGHTGWLQVDLGTQKDVARVEILFRNNDWSIDKQEFEILASNDATFATFVTLGQQGQDAQITPGGTWNLPVDATGQTYRYLRYHKRHGFGPVVNEFRVFERQGTATAPSAVTGVTATTLSANTVRVTWTDLSDETGYDVQYKAGVDGVWVDTTSDPSAGVTSQDITGLNPSTQYFVRVRGKNAAGDGAWSDGTATATTSAPLVSSGGLAGASAQPVAAEGADKAFDGMTSTKWLGTMGPGGAWIKYDFAAEDAYVVTRYTVSSANDVPARDPRDFVLQGSDDGAAWTNVGAAQTGQTFAARFSSLSYDVANTVGYKQYRLLIIANNGSVETQLGGNGMVQLSELQLFGTAAAPAVDTPPATPTGVTASATTNQVTLDWADNTEPDLAGYNVFRATSAGGVYTKVNTSLLTGSAFTDAGLAAGTSYFYKVAAVDTAGQSSAQSAAVSATTPAAPLLAPSNLTARALSSSQIRLNWTDNASNETGYRVWRSRDGVSWTLVSTLSANTVTFTDSGLARNTTHYYRVSAIDGVNEVFSSTVQSKTLKK
ncbi:MAG TPA: fibronectin type III domain-containing protein [Tepidisphaeraceae bacterium]|nr:fibronectin type III domain-containing protein [Tepidisphaeraceae bacterium]